jgi:hypothetical protein
MGSFPVSLEEVITAEDFSRIDPDEKAGEGYTGNAGCTMEYWYRRAAVARLKPVEISKWEAQKFAKPSAREHHTRCSAPKTTDPTNTSGNGAKRTESCCASCKHTELIASTIYTPPVEL